MEQQEITGTESPNRDAELHALGVELYDLQSRRMDLTKAEKEKRVQIAAALHARKLAEYHVDGIELWLEPGVEKVKVRRDSEGNQDEDEE